MTHLDDLLRVLAAEGIQYILIGGVAALAHGAARTTQDVDVVYARDAENLAKIVTALAPYKPYLRGAPPGLPFQWDVETLERGLNFTLETTLGDLDLLGEITGGGGFGELLPHTEELQIFGLRARCLDLPTLIAVKRAAGRPKDLEAIAELELLGEENGS
jgi:predicted nucleotidyltransferase